MNPSMTWHQVAARAPHFVQWVVATHGPLPDGPVVQRDYERLADEWWLAHVGMRAYA